jgi:Tol biopolymer transport system component
VRNIHLLLISSFLALGVSAHSAVQTPPLARLKIAFTSHHEKTSDIYVTEIGSGNLINLTRNGELNYFPDWSPDGKRVVWQVQHPRPPDADHSGHNQIYAMDADGSNQVNLTNDPAGDYYFPTWSPDGKRIAFVGSIGDNRNYGIGVMDSDGSNRKMITSGGRNVSPTWSPDGRRILFASDRDGSEALYLMNPDGSNVVRLTVPVGGPTLRPFSPTWSPDGKQIAFISSVEGNTEIYVMNADGSGSIQLTDTPEIEQYPKWSPDDKHILYIASPPDSKTLPDNVIYMMDADGSNQVKLAEGFGAAWVR